MQRLDDLTIQKLIEVAREAQEKAYAPYSRYRVGAAIYTDCGKILAGANIENRSYGGTVCAERTAISAMVMAGCTRALAVAVVTPDNGFPCGLCLQAISEFAPIPEECLIIAPNYENGVTIRTLAECAPYLWRSEFVQPKEPA